CSGPWHVAAFFPVYVKLPVRVQKYRVAVLDLTVVFAVCKDVPVLELKLVVAHDERAVLRDSLREPAASATDFIGHGRCGQLAAAGKRRGHQGKEQKSNRSLHRRRTFPITAQLSEL